MTGDLDRRAWKTKPGDVFRLNWPELGIENVPTDENPGTGRITAQSIVATLEGLASSLRIGT